MKPLDSTCEFSVDLCLLIRREVTSANNFGELRPECVFVVLVKCQPAVKHEEAGGAFRKLTFPDPPLTVNGFEKRVPGDAIRHGMQERRMRGPVRVLVVQDLCLEVPLPFGERFNHYSYTSRERKTVEPKVSPLASEQARVDSLPLMLNVQFCHGPTVEGAHHEFIRQVQHPANSKVRRHVNIVHDSPS